jgi:hypothetical protein
VCTVRVSGWLGLPPSDCLVEVHRTTLNNSIYRFDDEMLVNTHLYGVPGAYAPVPHLRRLAGGELFDIYATSFQRVWSRAVSVWPDS